MVVAVVVLVVYQEAPQGGNQSTFCNPEGNVILLGAQIMRGESPR